jgi:hypothetical protein
MRGTDTFTEGLFTLKKLDDFVPAKHPLRVIEHDAVVAFFNQVLKQAYKRQWLSKEHFSVDGTLDIKPGLATRASYAKTAKTMTTGATSEEGRAATRRTNPAPTPTAGCFAKPRRPASCASWATR